MGSFPTVTDAVKVEQQPVQLVLLFNNELRALSKHCKDKTLLCLPLPPQKKKNTQKGGGGGETQSESDGPETYTTKRTAMPFLVVPSTSHFAIRMPSAQDY